MMFFSANENPAVWERDFRLMAQHNIRILRILHFSPFAKDGYKGVGQHSSLDLRGLPPKRLQRQMDAIVQLAQKHGIVLFLSLHDWLGVVLTDEELEAQREWNRFWAYRYRNVPGILYDIQNEPTVEVPDVPFVRRLWNEWLKQRYGSDEALRTAWRANPPEALLPNVPLGNRTDRWDDVRTADLKRFETELLNRWVRANVEGVKAGDPDALVCVGYLPSMPPADKILGTRHTDFSNMLTARQTRCLIPCCSGFAREACCTFRATLGLTACASQPVQSVSGCSHSLSNLWSRPSRSKRRSGRCRRLSARLGRGRCCMCPTRWNCVRKPAIERFTPKHCIWRGSRASGLPFRTAMYTRSPFPRATEARCTPSCAPTLRVSPVA